MWELQVMFKLHFCCGDQMPWLKATQGRKGLSQLIISGYSPSLRGSQDRDFKKPVTPYAQSRTKRNKSSHVLMLARLCLTPFPPILHSSGTRAYGVMLPTVSLGLFSSNNVLRQSPTGQPNIDNPSLRVF